MPYNRPMLPVIPFPAIDPIIVEIGPFALRWYALAYVAGILIGWRLILRLAAREESGIKPTDTDDFLLWATLGVVLGGRSGYVLFYRPGYYFENPLEIPAMWHGGMSFHGGMLGVCAAILLFAWVRRLPVFGLSDLMAAVTPIGLFFGRLANFINGELYGRVSDVPWAMVFPGGGPEPRHPSQLYQAGLEGLCLGGIGLIAVYGFGGLKRRGLLTGLFLAGYAVARMIGELFRQPDAHIGFLSGGSTMGQWLSVPMLLVGLGFIGWSLRRR
jgi:phosphatidylglycerol:prolipoprotein diacylglycerol transferase